MLLHWNLGKRGGKGEGNVIESVLLTLNTSRLPPWSFRRMDAIVSECFFYSFYLFFFIWLYKKERTGFLFLVASQFVKFWL